MNKSLVIGIIAAIVIVGGIAAYSASNSKNEVASDKMTAEEKMTAENKMSEEAKMEQEKMAKETAQGDAMKKDGEVMTKEGEAMKKDGEVMEKKSGSYKDYSVATVEAEQKAGNKVVLFFHATWCPACKEANTAFKASPEKIPAGVTVLKIDYDTNLELRKKYGLTSQHTFVQVDNNENLITKWTSGDIDMLVKNIK